MAVAVETETTFHPGRLAPRDVAVAEDVVAASLVKHVSD